MQPATQVSNSGKYVNCNHPGGGGRCRPATSVHTKAPGIKKRMLSTHIRVYSIQGCEVVVVSMTAYTLKRPVGKKIWMDEDERDSAYSGTVSSMGVVLFVGVGCQSMWFLVP